MPYDPEAHMAEIEEKGDVSRSDWFRMLRGHEDNRREIDREREEKKNKKQQLYNQIEDEDLMQTEKRNQREGLMSTSKFNVKSIMPQVKSLVANKQFEASGNASHSVMGDSTFSAKGGRRTRSKRSGKRSAHNKRINKKRSNKRSGHKRSGHKSRRR